jgi:hypothetical protein
VNVADLTTAAIFHGRQLVTASALLDLVSEPWLQALAVRCREHASAVLFALNYDGRIQCWPEEPGDEQVRELVGIKGSERRWGRMRLRQPRDSSRAPAITCSAKRATGSYRRTRAVSRRR